MVSYGIRTGVQWTWENFLGQEWPLNVGWLPGVYYDENNDDDEFELGDGWYSYDAYGSCMPKMGSEAVTWMAFGSPEFWPDLPVSIIDTPRDVTFGSDISNGPRAATYAHPTWWGYGLVVSGYLRDIKNDTMTSVQTNTHLAVGGALVSSPGIGAGMKSSQPVGAVSITFTNPNIYEYISAKDIEVKLSTYGAWPDSWGWDSIQIKTYAYGSELLATYVASTLSTNGWGGFIVPNSGKIYSIRVEHVAPGTHGLPNFFIERIKFTAETPTALTPVYPPQNAASWSKVLQQMHVNDFRCWFGQKNPTKSDFFPPSIANDIYRRGLNHYNLGWGMDDMEIQRVTSMALATNTVRNTPLDPAQNINGWDISDNPPYAPIYGIDYPEGHKLGQEIVAASTGSVFIGIILPGCLSQSAFGAMTNLYGFIHMMLGQVSTYFPTARVFFVSTGIWDETASATLLDFDGSKIVVGGDGLWTNASRYAGRLDTHTCKPLADVCATTADGFFSVDLTAAYGSNPTVTPALTATTNWPAADIYRHLIGKAAKTGRYDSKHIVDLTSYNFDYSMGLFVYDDFGPWVPSTTPYYPMRLNRRNDGNGVSERHGRINTVRQEWSSDQSNRLQFGQKGSYQ